MVLPDDLKKPELLETALKFLDIEDLYVEDKRALRLTNRKAREAIESNKGALTTFVFQDKSEIDEFLAQPKSIHRVEEIIIFEELTPEQARLFAENEPPKLQLFRFTVGEGGAEAIFSCKFPQLKALVFSHNWEDDTVWRLLSKVSWPLEQLQLGCGAAAGSRAVSKIAPHSLAAIISNFPELRFLVLESLNLPPSQPSPTTLDILQKGLGKLKVLAVNNSIQFEALGLFHVDLPALKEFRLTISGNKQWLIDSFKKCTWMKQLTALDMRFGVSFDQWFLSDYDSDEEQLPEEFKKAVSAAVKGGPLENLNLQLIDDETTWSMA